jgi:hypothetical protein
MNPETYISIGVEALPIGCGVKVGDFATRAAWRLEEWATMEHGDIRYHEEYRCSTTSLDGPMRERGSTLLEQGY